jgi:hypothetical protein
MNGAGAEAELQKLVRMLATYNTARLKREAIVYTIDHQKSRWDQENDSQVKKTKHTVSSMISD